MATTPIYKIRRNASVRSADEYEGIFAITIDSLPYPPTYTFLDIHSESYTEWGICKGEADC